MATPYACSSCQSFGADQKKSISSGRNLVVCIDGTSQQFGEKNTNIIELYNQMLKDSTQLTYYNSGIGTYAKPSKMTPGHWKRVMDSEIDLAIAWNFDRIVKAAYRWLSQHYQEGDRIYLFGFSRGAYQVGLIHKGNEEQIPFAYSLYEHSSHDDLKQEAREGEKPIISNHALEKSLSTEQTPVSENSVARCAEQCDKFPQTGQTSAMSEQAASSAQRDNRRSLPERFKVAFSRKVRVHFVGVWDTVSSIGVIRGKNLPWNR
ncbi:hypothetical protein A0H81_11012 [Grifola frondosa]|uniref:T6SS Phospholipase effector Tle1-like catalytic domain-containing protein n=1 Tax=Grifola frondosa TaxID=5627 RepID=A0A1C7LWR6_GRIFR|nr:hypothetical protein A0H81_11012 [Grifola frondosa]